MRFLARPLPRCVWSALLAAVWLAGAGRIATAADLPLPPSRRVTRPSAARVELAAGGAALLPVVVAAGADEQVKAAAAELAAILGQIVGGGFDVRAGDERRGILLGTLEDFPDAEAQEHLTITGCDGREAYVIRSRPDHVLLLGATPLGARHAAFRFLELLGWRHFFPAPEWEVVPHAPDLSFATDESDRPVILSRRIWYGFGFFLDWTNARRHDARCKADYEAWARHNRMAASFTVSTGHAWDGIIAAHAGFFAAHPEALAIHGGVRQKHKFCPSDPRVRRLVVDHAVAHFARFPRADMVSVEPSDGGGHCECESCAGQSVSDRVFGLANEAARAVARAWPGKQVGLLAYNLHSDPPSFPLEPNVYVQRTAGFVVSRHAPEELTARWLAASRNLGYYDYLSTWPWDHDTFPGGLANDLTRLVEHVRLFARRGGSSIDCESSNNWGIHGRGYYVANRLMWDPSTDVDAVLADFYDKAFGPAAEAMRRYYDFVDAGSGRIPGAPFLGQAHRLLAEASVAAAGRVDVQARLDQLKQYLRYTVLWHDLNNEPDIAARKSLTVAAWTHVFRTRYSYMNHWAAMFYSWKANAIREFDEPSWWASDPAPKPWFVHEPMTHEETERDFQAGLARLGGIEATETAFSDDLVPVEPPGGKDFRSRVGHDKVVRQGGGPVAIHVSAAGPLEVEITVAAKAGPPAEFRLLDRDGSELARASLPRDGATTTPVWRVPAAGTYFLHGDRSASWTFTNRRPGQVAGFPLLRTKRQGIDVAPPWYVYVPRGTRRLRYHWYGGDITNPRHTHEVMAADGRLLARVPPGRWRLVTIDIPAGVDGSVIAFRNLMLNFHLWFLDAPNVVAMRPETMLVPRELARRDGLGIVE